MRKLQPNKVGLQIAMFRTVSQKLEESYGAMMTYSTSIVTVSVGTWMGENWFLILSAIAVMIRIGIDVPKLLESWKRKKNVEE
jgi:sulfatase maturation enzyme AslB (radical SAM superfamily)